MDGRHSAYHDRLQRVIDHIHSHLDEDLSLDRLAEVACFSPHHWHRIYHGITGETLSVTIRRLRLHRAAGQLSQSTTPLAEIAKVSGYG
ncbi:MAG: helix-turn-helix domain-containing protein [Rhodospirillaceae bacterium]